MFFKQKINILSLKREGFFLCNKIEYHLKMGYNFGTEIVFKVPMSEVILSGEKNDSRNRTADSAKRFYIYNG
ncbi:hypothetical protein BAT02nite_14920 [Bacillus atrophaeus]|nr:hypothetical protein BAT02nite_14920 [Bacillus atrophaeus]